MRNGRQFIHAGMAVFLFKGGYAGKTFLTIEE